MPISISDPLVTLQSGQVFPLSLISRLIALEDGGVQFVLQPDGSVIAGPRAALTAGDVVWLREHRDIIRHAIAATEASCARPL